MLVVEEEQEGAPAAVVEREVAGEAEGQEVVQGEEQEEEGEWGEEIAPGPGRAETVSARNVKPRHLT